MYYVERPVWDRRLHSGKRNEIRFRRVYSAWELASRICPDGVTEEEFDAAFSLLSRIQRWGLADVAHWERENTYERYANSQQCKDDAEKLDKRRRKLNEELKRYRARLDSYGLYPCITELEPPRGRDLYMLHWFD